MTADVLLFPCIPSSFAVESLADVAAAASYDAGDKYSEIYPPSRQQHQQLIDDISSDVPSTFASYTKQQQKPTPSSSLNTQQQSCSQQQSHHASTHNSKYDTTFVRNTVALAVITRLHRWCCQLFWLTIVCVIGCCGELQSSKSKTLADVRRTIAHSSQRRCKTVTDLEMQLLRHLTCPQTAVLRPLRTSSLKKRYHLSRPPSPQLFDILEADEKMD